MTRLIAIVLAAILGGCATYYEAPQRTPSATLGVVTELRPVMVYRFDDKECTPSTQGARLLFIDPKFHPDSKRSGPIRIEANRELVMTFHKSTLANLFATDRWGCDVTIRFTPKPDQYYEAEFREAPPQPGQRPGMRPCGVTLWRTELDSSGKRYRVRENEAVRNENACTSSQ